MAAEDAGVVVSDVDNVHMRTRYTTCISEDLGGSGNPSIATGNGKNISLSFSLGQVAPKPYCGLHKSIPTSSVFCLTY